MCGIFGAVLRTGDAAPVVHRALERLEYRGYDSVGIATISKGGLEVKKDRGSIRDVDLRLHLDEMDGSVGVGHTRWATHGMPSLENAHPHLSCKGDVAVVHNGIIENFLELKRELEGRNHLFRSRTDTEVIPHVVEEYLADGLVVLRSSQVERKQVRVVEVEKIKASAIDDQMRPYVLDKDGFSVLSDKDIFTYAARILLKK